MSSGWGSVRLVVAGIGGELRGAEAARPGSNPQVRRLEDEVEELKAGLGEAHVELRVWKKSAEYRLGPTWRVGGATDYWSKPELG